MSEYQYYEFRAIDRMLSRREMAALRRASTRAEITPASFVNFYNWGDLKADPSAWMGKYFDAFLYLANWGTRQLMLRFPKRSLDLRTARRYCPGYPAEARARGDSVILELTSEDDDSDWESIGEGLLSPIIPVRAAILDGDHRALYLTWLLAIQEGEVDEDAPEPPFPPGLGKSLSQNSIRRTEAATHPPYKGGWVPEAARQGGPTMPYKRSNKARRPDAEWRTCSRPNPGGGFGIGSRLTAPLRAFADFLRIRDDLIKAAALRDGPARRGNSITRTACQLLVAAERLAAGRRGKKVRRSVR